MGKYLTERSGHINVIFKDKFELHQRENQHLQGWAGLGCDGLIKFTKNSNSHRNFSVNAFCSVEATSGKQKRLKLFQVDLLLRL